jgi:hypothetical protein
MTAVLPAKVRATAEPISSVAPKSIPAHRTAERVIVGFFMYSPPYVSFAIACHDDIFRAQCITKRIDFPYC